MQHPTRPLPVHPFPDRRPRGKRSRLRQFLAGVAEVAALALAAPAFGAVIPAGTTPADDIVWNFDLTSSSTDWDSITLRYVGFSSPDATGGDQGGGGPPNLVGVTVDIFGGLDGTSYISSRSVSINAVGATVGESLLNLAGVLDGLFSVGLRVAPGDTASGSLAAFGVYTIDGQGSGSMQGDIRVTTNPVAGVISTTQPPMAVPEPGTLALIPLALAGLALPGRRRLHPPALQYSS